MVERAQSALSTVFMVLAPPPAGAPLLPPTSCICAASDCLAAEESPTEPTGFNLFSQRPRNATGWQTHSDYMLQVPVMSIVGRDSHASRADDCGACNQPASAQLGATNLARIACLLEVGHCLRATCTPTGIDGHRRRSLFVRRARPNNGLPIESAKPTIGRNAGSHCPLVSHSAGCSGSR